MRNYRTLDVWKESHELTLQVYKVTERFPSGELYSLTSQIRRACYSIPMNIAEGCGKSTEADFARFLDISSGSASELDYQLLLVRDLGYVSPETYQDLSEKLNHIRRMLTSLIKTTRSRSGQSGVKRRNA
jgi:four helix bundle protein